MSIVLLLLTIIVFCLLVLVAAMRPSRSKLSNYELRRRANNGDRQARESIARNKLLRDVESNLRIKVSLLLVATAFLLVATFGWLGYILALLVVFVYGATSHLRVVSRAAGKLYCALESQLLGLAQKLAGVMPFIRSTQELDMTIRLGSTQELAHIVDQSEGVLSTDEKKLIVHSLAFSNKIVADIMTPTSDIISIKKTEFLGPLTLDELHRSGHSRLPVIGSDIHHIVGILRIHNLLALDQKRSMTAEKAMDQHVMYVRDDQTLPHALAALLRTHQHLFIVVDKEQATVGLITLDDIIEALIGHKILDEFDNHESIRAVSTREPHNKHQEV